MSIAYCTIGVKKNGTCVATGLNNNGQINVTNWTDIIQVACGGSHTVGLKADGTCVGTGLNSSGTGQINVTNWTDIIQVACGYDNTIGLKRDGTCVAVGSADLNGDSTGMDLLVDIKQIALSRYNAIGVKNDGSVVIIGNSQSGLFDANNWTNIKQVATGTIFAIGLKNDGTCVATGLNDYGQCDISTWTNIVQVSCGSDFTIGLKADGTCVGVGRNTSNQYVGIENWTDIVQVSCGSQFVVGLKKDGTVVAVGESSDNKLNVQDFEDISSLMTSDVFMPFPRLTDDFVVKNNLNYVSYEGEYFQLNSTTNYVDKYFLPNFTKNTIDIRKNKFTIDSSKTLSNIYNISQFKYDKTSVESVNSITCNYPNGKFLLRDGVKIYALNPLNYLHDGNPTDEEIDTYGVSNPKLTKEELGQLSLDCMFIGYHSEVVGEDIYIVVNETLNRSFISVLAHEPNFRMYINKASYDGELDIIGSKLSPYSYTGRFDGTQIVTEDNILTDTESSCNLKSTLFSTSENPYNFKLDVTQDNEKVVSKTTKLVLRNVAPQLIMNMTGMYLKIDIDDDDRNKIKYRLIVNGTRIYPKDTEWSPLLETPYITTKRFKSNEIIVEGENIAQVDVVDEYGKSTSLTYKFIGECSGLLFMNEYNQMYSDDLGNIIRTLEFGNILAGKSSKVEKIKLKNNCGFNVKDITIQIDSATVPQGSTILLDTNFENFKGSNTLQIQRLANGAEIEFYIRVLTDIEQETGGTFDITVTSTSDFS